MLDLELDVTLVSSREEPEPRAIGWRLQQDKSELLAMLLLLRMRDEIGAERFEAFLCGGRGAT